jgi:hypothetical protein
MSVAFAKLELTDAVESRALVAAEVVILPVASDMRSAASEMADLPLATP